MKKINLILLSSILALIFTACGNSSEANLDGNNENITVGCVTSNAANATSANIATYQQLNSGDKVKANPIGNVQIHTPIGQNSRVCLENGNAIILKN